MVCASSQPLLTLQWHTSPAIHVPVPLHICFLLPFQGNTSFKKLTSKQKVPPLSPNLSTFLKARLIETLSSTTVYTKYFLYNLITGQVQVAEKYHCYLICAILSYHISSYKKNLNSKNEFGKKPHPEYQTDLLASFSSCAL